MRWMSSCAFAVFLLLAALFLVLVDAPLVSSPLAGGSPTVEQRIMHAETMAYLHGEDADLSFYTRAEQEHLRDVRRLLNIARILIALTGGVILWTLWRLHQRSGAKRVQGRKVLAGLLTRAGVTLIVLLFLLGLSALNFSVFWEWFHRLLFPQGNYTFPASSVLITLYPESYWLALTAHVLGAALGLGLLCLLGAVLLSDKYK